MQGQVRLVIVEDRESDAELIARHLAKSSLDCVIHRVQTESHFVAALREIRPHVILSDFSMPQFDGLRALEIAHQQASDTPFIFVSGTIGEERAIDALRRGATDYVLKSNLARLAAAVERALREAAMKAAQRQSAQRLRDNEQRLRDTVETSQDWIWEIDTESRFRFCSGAVAHILGYEAEQMLGEDFRNYLHEDERERAGSLLPVAAQMHLTGAVARWRGADGQVRWLERNVVVIVDAAGRPTGFRGTDRDITARREQEARLRRLTRTYRMLSSTGSAILRLRDRSELLDEICRIAVHQGGYERVVISWIDPGAKVLRPRAWAGADSEPLRAFDRAFEQQAPPIFAAAEVRGVAAQGGMTRQAMSHDAVTNNAEARRAARATAASAVSAAGGAAESGLYSGAPLLCNDLSAEGLPLTHTRVLVEHGYRALASLPLLIDGTTVGLIILCSSQPGVFDKAEVGVLLELTANLSFALQYLDKDEAVHFLSYFDSLTGLAKRPLFCQRLAQRLSSQTARDMALVVVVFDVQQLGAINDSLGRYVGDRLIERISERLKQSHGSEFAAHFGGGTFAMVFSSAGQAGETGRTLQNAAAQLFVEPFLVEGHELRPVVRAGLALYPHDADSADTLVQNAEAALKAARAENERYMLYGFVRHHTTTRSLALEARLAAALDRNEFRLHYQPKVDIHTGRVEGLEALLRWQDVQEGLVPPSLFVPLLERSGAIAEVGEWVMQQAVRDMALWSATGRSGICVAINVSPLQLRRRDFVERVLASIRPPAGQSVAVDIEITESMLMQDIELSIRKLSELREAGIGVAIDDFGTGYSSLRLLARLPVDTLKIDRSFIQSIGDAAKGLTLVSTIVSLARALDMKSVAEGVETAEQLELLRRVECHQAQGFYFGQPAPVSELPAMIDRLNQGR